MFPCQSSRFSEHRWAKWPVLCQQCLPIFDLNACQLREYEKKKHTYSWIFTMNTEKASFKMSNWIMKSVPKLTILNLCDFLSYFPDDLQSPFLSLRQVGAL